jgi:hypothetical protein|tara:strand:+ start:108 stop:704 length:597 start_codon:yes stop_codon:yes gene_type:complete
MAFNIDTFKGQIPGGGARPTLFFVELTGAEYSQVPFMAKAASLPASTLGTIELSYFGRKVKVAGDRTYAEWSITIINDEDMLIRKGLENWHSKVNHASSNLRSMPDYKEDAQVHQMGKTGNKIRTYNFVGLWPSEIGAIELAWDTNDAVEEYTVTLQYDYWTVGSGAGDVMAAAQISGNDGTVMGTYSPGSGNIWSGS